MKIKFFSNYDRSENLLKRFLANYEVPDQVLDFTTDDDYDYAVIFNNTTEKLKPQAKTITVIQEPSWSSVNLNNQFLTNSDYLIIHDPKAFEDLYQIELGRRVFESPAYMFYHDHVHRSFFYGSEAVEKTRKLSIIVSSLSLDIGNYGKRLKLLRKILNSDLDIDIYGKGFSIPDSRYKGSLEYKYAGLLPYEYSIAIENSNEKNYITEKFFDCALCNTVPIYNGAPNISAVYNERYFRTIDLDSPTVIQDIKAIISEAAPALTSDTNKMRYFQRYNLYNLLKDVVKYDS